MTEDPEVYYSCSDCVLSFVKDASNGVYVEATTDHARCSTGCRAKATFVCRVYPDEQVGDLKEESEETDVQEPSVCTCVICKLWDNVVKKQEASPPVQAPAPKEFCPKCYYMTVTEETLFKAREAIMKVLPFEETSHAIINEFLNAGLLIRERI